MLNHHVALNYVSRSYRQKLKTTTSARASIIIPENLYPQSNSRVNSDRTMKLALAAFVLSVIALGVAISQPLWNLYSTPTPAPAPQGEPLFVLTDHWVYQFETQINILNNGTATAHDIKVVLGFSGGNGMLVSEFISELANKTTVSLAMPLGSFQMTYGGQHLSSYQGTVGISCREIPLGKLFTFDVE